MRDQVRRSALLFFAAALIANLIPIRSYDYFWHLASGRWIAQHRALPAQDPFTVASDRVEWIDGEWLFQLLAWAAENLFGHTGVSVIRAAIAAALFAFLFAKVAAHASRLVALLLILIAMIGADHRLGARPELLAIVCLVAFLAILSSVEKNESGLADAPPSGIHRPARFLMLLVLTVFWINVHPSALLAPILCGLWWAGRFIEARPSHKELAIQAGTVVLTGLSLMVNPYGIRGVTAPLHLASQVGSGTFTNTEWMWSDPRIFPLLYLVLAVGGMLFARNLMWKRHASRFLIFLALGVLAIRFVRNHGFLFAALPLLLLPLIPGSSPTVPLRRVLRVASAIAGALFLFSHLPLRVGIDPGFFPLDAARIIAERKLAGNIYNPDQFGGYLIWQLGSGRVLTDGRNELYRGFLAEYEQARLDGRKWPRLLERYRIDLAVEEYRPEMMETINAATGERTHLPASSVYFPRRDWALIAFDDVAMVFARRMAFDPAQIADLEFRLLSPEMPENLGGVDRNDAERELFRARLRQGSSTRLERMEMSLAR